MERENLFFKLEQDKAKRTPLRMIKETNTLLMIVVPFNYLHIYLHV